MYTCFKGDQYMTKESFLDMDDEAYAAWYQAATGNSLNNPNGVTDEDLIALLSDAIRCQTKERKAEYLLKLANMSIALADKTLGCQSIVATSLIFKH